MINFLYKMIASLRFLVKIFIKPLYSSNIPLSRFVKKLTSHNGEKCENFGFIFVPRLLNVVLFLYIFFRCLFLHLK